MLARRTSTAALAALLLGAVCAPGAGCAASAGAAPRPSTGPAAPSRHAVPPKAPKPTDGANSPAAPDPNPPAGGLGPHGEPVGGKRLLGRRLVLPKGAPALPADLTARAWVLVDLDNGDVLAARDPHGRYQAASIQKLLTTVTLLPLLPGSRKVTVSRKAAETEGSHAGLVSGGSYTIDQIFKGLLLVSGNDAAEALAEAAGGRARTVALMNRAALRLGAFDTFVQTPSGLDGWQQLTSAYDMALFLRAAVDQPRFVKYDTVLRTHLPAQKVDGIGRIELDNQNVQFLTTVRGALVAKTGYTDAAQHTFAGAIERHGHRYGVILLRAQRWPDDQWQQATKLVDWGLSLPRGTKPVGHLDAPSVPAPSNASSVSSAPAFGSGTAPAAAAAGAVGASSNGVQALAVAVFLAAVGFAVSWRRLRGRRLG